MRSFVRAQWCSGLDVRGKGAVDIGVGSGNLDSSNVGGSCACGQHELCGDADSLPHQREGQGLLCEQPACTSAYFCESRPGRVHQGP